MAYQSIEQITSRGYEKVTMFLTVQQVFGLLSTLLPGAVFMGALPDIGGLRTIFMIVLALLGYVSATEMNGMAPYERILWQVRGFTRMLLRGRTIAPDDLPGAALQMRVPISWAGSRVRLAAHPTSAHGMPTHPLSRRGRRAVVPVPPMVALDGAEAVPLMGDGHVAG